MQLQVIIRGVLARNSNFLGFNCRVSKKNLMGKTCSIWRIYTSARCKTENKNIRLEIENKKKEMKMYEK